VQEGGRYVVELSQFGGIPGLLFKFL